MNIEYDPQANAAYIKLVSQIEAGGVARTVPCDPVAVGEINLDFDSDGFLIGVEIMDANKRLRAETLRGE